MALKESKKLEQANSYELVVTVDGETFEKALNTVYKKEVKKINIPGFRKGKAPRHIIEKMMTLCRIAILRLFTTQQKRQA